MFFQYFILRFGVSWSVILFHGLVNAKMPLSGRAQSDDLSVYDFDANDIFDDKLLPMQLFSRELEGLLLNEEQVTQKDQNASLPESEIIKKCDLETAFKAMKFHRHMMNEFMLSHYLMQQILKINRSSLESDDFQFQKRLGTANISSQYGAQTGNTTKPESATKKHRTPGNHKLLEDEGSFKYKSWLEKTSTLEDIHKQMERKLKAVPRSKRKRPSNNRRRVSYDIEPTVDSQEDEDFEDGDITGYAMTGPNPYEYNLQLSNHQQWQRPMMSNTEPHQTLQSLNKKGLERGYGEHNSHSSTSGSRHHSDSKSTAASTQNKEIGLKDITDIALTTLAFISFGMFILQVLMCITMGKEDLTVTPMESTATGELPQETIEEIRRRKRSTPHSNEPIIIMNEVARRILFSIDAVLESDGSCHYWTLCENNRFAKTQAYNQKYWMPIWSLGVSWYYYTSKNVAKANQYISLLQSLKAILTGVANKNKCDMYYEKGCKKL